MFNLPFSNVSVSVLVYVPFFISLIALTKLVLIVVCNWVRSPISSVLPFNSFTAATTLILTVVCNCVTSPIVFVSPFNSLIAFTTLVLTIVCNWLRSPTTVLKSIKAKAASILSACRRSFSGTSASAE